MFLSVSSSLVLDCLGIVTTVRCLFYFDRPDAILPWRGWRMGLASFPLAADAPALLYGLAALELVVKHPVILRYLCNPQGWLPNLTPLPIPPPASFDAVKGLRNEELRLAALDHNIKPVMLLFIQAAMPFYPRHPDQHSLRALADLLWRISSSINVRILRQHLSGGPAAELFRIAQFVGADANVDTTGTNSTAAIADGQLATPKKLPLWKTMQWSSAAEAMHLTRHEKLLLLCIQSVQRHLLMLPDIGASPPKASQFLEPPQATKVNSGRSPSALESRTGMYVGYRRSV